MPPIQWLLTSLFVSHVVGDFYLQSNRLCQQKQEKKALSPFMYLHAALMGILAWAMVPQSGFVICALGIAVTHLAIDMGKAYVRHGIAAFVIDQLLHIAVLVVVALLYVPQAMLPLQWFAHVFPISFILLVLGMMVAGKPTNILIKLILEKYQIGSNESCREIKNAGALIGNLERVLTIIFVLIGRYEAVGFIIAAKSILRFKDTDTPKTEYVLAGTFLSFGIAVIIGLVIDWLSCRL